ncbi:MAG: hypothetical protein DI535_14050 [Citrobacter freundii]|nr:MAG: hypothetical protein DI535_14050 [Citrobacter freundii]
MHPDKTPRSFTITIHIEEKMTLHELRKAVGTSAALLVVRRDEIKPSIDTASKITDALVIILDYLAKDAQYRNSGTNPCNIHGSSKTRRG